MQDGTGKTADTPVMRALFDRLNMGVLQIDASSRITYANPFSSELLHRPREQIEKKLFHDVFPQPVARRFYREMERAAARDAAASFEAICPALDNIWFLFRCVPSAEGSTVFFEDITELKNAREDLARTRQELEHRVQERTKNLRRTSRMLEEQKELLVTIIDNIPVMLIFYDSSGAVRLVNKAFERLAGWSMGEARRMNLMAAMFPDPVYRKEVWEFMMKSRPEWKDLELTTREGKILQSSWANVFLSDGSQISIGIDISERIKMEKERIRLASAIEQADEGVVIFNHRWRIEYVDSAFEDLSDMGRQELIGRSISDLTGFFPDETYREIVDRAEKEGKKWTGRLRRKKASGEIIEVDLAVSPVYDEKGRIIDYILLAHDVTDEVRLQRQLLQIQKMEAIGNLAGGIAQNLKNAFTPILIDIEVLMQDLGEQSPSYPILEEMLRATYQAIDLVRNLLIFSRRTPPAKVPMDMVPTFREAVNFLRASLPSTIEIRRAVEVKSARVLADQAQIKQMLINLGSNAGSSMQKTGGVMEVRLARDILDAESALKFSPDLVPGRYVRIQVSDTGMGMDEETLKHIFEPFFTTKEMREGRGLGLPVVQGIVKDLGGAITVDSEPGKGTTFTVLLPEL
ncbi:MAG: PAS domain-containing sensor histidine kinase [Desulfomonilia bacterium]|jgi:PAS domain S-box-containing protein|nr:PAS domain-containing protein [Pseudomonadota bacterium]HPD20393.1 PAS domain-containing protein [Deltaproteobacteria bacterium]HRV34845.1 PAS domain-containing protein [Desulfomonilia bacterium]